MLMSGKAIYGMTPSYPIATARKQKRGTPTSAPLFLCIFMIYFFTNLPLTEVMV